MKNTKRQQDILLAIVGIVIGVTIFFLIPGQVRTVETGTRSTVTARTFPYLADILLIVSSAGLLLRSLLKRKPEAVKEEDTAEQPPAGKKTEKRNTGRAAFVFLLMIAYAAVMNLIGFVLSSILFGVIFLYIAGIRKWWQYVIFILLVFPLFALFKYALYVPLPTLLL